MKPNAPKQPKKVNEKDNQMSKDMMESMFRELEEDKPTNGNNRGSKVDQPSRNFSDLRIEDELTVRGMPQESLTATMDAGLDDELEALEARYTSVVKIVSSSVGDNKMDIERPV